jgi:hypothetical protein
MSEISTFAVVLFLPIVAGICIAKLCKHIGSAGMRPQKKYHWPCTIERDELLQNNYHKELAQFEKTKLVQPGQSSLGVLRDQQLHLEAMMRSLESVDVISLIAKEKHGHQFDEIKSNLKTIGETIKTDSSNRNISEMVQRTDSLLRSLTLAAHSTLADIEREATSDLMTETLQSMGYGLVTKGNVLLGNSGETSIRAKVLSGGSVLLDTTSFSGLSCQREVAKIENKLRERGVVLRRILSEQSKRSEGVMLRDPFPPLKTEPLSIPEIQTKSQQAKSPSIDQGQYHYLMNQSQQRQIKKIKEV